MNDGDELVRPVEVQARAPYRIGLRYADSTAARPVSRALRAGAC